MNREVITVFVATANVLVFIFGVLAILLIVRELVGVFRLLVNRKRSSVSKSKDPAELLAELAQTKSSYEKASIFVSLILVGYVLSHKIVNAGGKYDDDKQRTRFKHFLTPVAIKKLNNMDGSAL